MSGCDCKRYILGREKEVVLLWVSVIVWGTGRVGSAMEKWSNLEKAHRNISEKIVSTPKSYSDICDKFTWKCYMKPGDIVQWRL